jgi:hypothetical protein
MALLNRETTPFGVHAFGLLSSQLTSALLAFSSFIDFRFPSHLNQINALVDSEREYEQVLFLPFNHNKEAGMVQKYHNSSQNLQPPI